jgi:hypothetical protein
MGEEEMTREEILELLRSELVVDTRLNLDSGYYDESSTLRVSVTLKLGDDVISESSDCVSIQENK